MIQPLVLERLPCYALTLVTGFTLGSCPLAVSALTLDAPDSRSLAGGVYKTRERIHRDMLIHDY